MVVSFISDSDGLAFSLLFRRSTLKTTKTRSEKVNVYDHCSSSSFFESKE